MIAHNDDKPKYSHCLRTFIKVKDAPMFLYKKMVCICMIYLWDNKYNYLFINLSSKGVLGFGGATGRQRHRGGTGWRKGR